MARTTTSSHDIEALTAAEIARQLTHYGRRRDEATAELASIFAARQDGSSPQPQPIPDQVRRARERAKQLLNGQSPASLNLPAAVGRESELELERDALDIVITALRQTETAARAAESVIWMEQHAAEWVGLCRQRLLTAIRLEALERRSNEMLRKVEVGTPIRLGIFNATSILDAPWSIDPLREFREALLREKIISASDIERAENA